jgi:hypothetical protein
MKQTIKLNETDLRQIIKGAIKHTLTESLGNTDYQTVEGEILKETDKACYIGVRYFTEKGDISGKIAKMWCPKSCLIVENGAIVKVAKFILDKWLQEYSNYIKSKGGYKIPKIIFDRKDKEFIETQKQQKQDELEGVYYEILNRMIKDIQPLADEFLQAAGECSIRLGEYLKSRGTQIEKCNNLIVLGKKIRAEFGGFDISDWYEQFFPKKPNKEELISLVKSFEKTPIYDGCKFKHTDEFLNNKDDYRNTKYSTRFIKYQLLDGIKPIGTFHGKFGEGKLYEFFKKYVEYYYKFINMAFDALK